jgi:tetratricopeptide (TPR) repeat protein
VGASRLVLVRCFDQGTATAIEAQTFDTSGPIAGTVFRVSASLTSLPDAVDRIARDLGPPGAVLAEGAFKAPSARALALAGPALVKASAAERAASLRAALSEDPASIDLRISAVEAHIASRDFLTAIDLAAPPRGSTDPGVPLLRRLRFLAAAARLEAGRYLEARDTLEELGRDAETAAVLNNLGVAKFRLRDPLASGSFERALFFKDHRVADISFNRSLALIFENKAALALPALDAVLLADPDDVRSRLLRVWALKFLDRDLDRAAEWDRLVARAPSFSALASPDMGRKLERILFFERAP